LPEVVAVERVAVEVLVAELEDTELLTEFPQLQVLLFQVIIPIVS
jgi:hypothetical protein|tara:strand:+ start:791 stop:925 length:135 start_codon:yes stop_codon:yes gene_type:complete